MHLIWNIYCLLVAVQMQEERSLPFLIMAPMIEWGNTVKKHAVFTVQKLPCQQLQSLFYSKGKCKMQVQEKLGNYSPTPLP